MYANTNFKITVDEWGNVTKWIRTGEEVTQDDLKVSDEEWQALVDANAVVEEYPEDLDPQVPPVEYFKQNPLPSPVDETTPSPEAMAKTSTATARGEKLPGAEEAEDAQNEQVQQGEPNKPGWMK